jgi:hypothetical protein
MSTRDRAFAVITKALAVCLLPAGYLRAPGHSRYFACQWALALRFPAEDLRGLTREAFVAFTTARTEAFWRDGQLIGLTSGHRNPSEQYLLFGAEVRRTGSPQLARRRVLPPEESAHVRGIAMDVRPVEGARWLEDKGWRYQLYRTYDNEWWHFEHRHRPPLQLPHPGALASFV